VTVCAAGVFSTKINTISENTVGLLACRKDYGATQNPVQIPYLTFFPRPPDTLSHRHKAVGKAASLRCFCAHGPSEFSGGGKRKEKKRLRLNKKCNFFQRVVSARDWEPFKTQITPSLLYSSVSNTEKMERRIKGVTKPPISRTRPSVSKTSASGYS